MKITIKRAGGYDPKLGPEHPSNRDPTLDDRDVTTKFDKDGGMTRKIHIEGDDGGCITVTERDNDDNLIEVESPSGFHATVVLDAARLWNLCAAILVEMFGGAVLTHDEKHATEETLRGKIHDVLLANEARCLDDNIDRDVVVAELVKALT